jgi:dCMP deaminase
MKKRIPKWDKFFLGLAEYVSRASKDPSTKVGAVLVSPDRTDIILGYNGFARKMKDDKRLYSDRKKKYPRIIHGEMNAVMLARRSVAGYTLYTYPFISCDRCAVHMIQAGIVRAVALAPTQEQQARWGEAFTLTRQFFAEAGVKLVEYIVK